MIPRSGGGRRRDLALGAAERPRRRHRPGRCGPRPGRGRRAASDSAASTSGADAPADVDGERRQQREEDELAGARAGPEDAGHEAAVLDEPAGRDGRAEDARDEARPEPGESPKNRVSCQISRTRLVATRAPAVTTRLSRTTLRTPIRPISQPLSGPDRPNTTSPTAAANETRRRRPAGLLGHRQDERARCRADAGRHEHDDRRDRDDDPAVEERASADVMRGEVYED